MISSPHSRGSLLAPAARSNRRALLKGLTGGAATLAGLVASQPTRGQQATPATEAGSVTTDVAYAEVDGKTLYADIYQPPAREAARPAALVFYPGGFFDGARVWMTEYAQGLAEAGYVAFVVDYRLAHAADTEPLWPKPLLDAQAAVRWVRANADEYGVDPGRVASFGYSAGGKLALQLGMRDALGAGDAGQDAVSSRVNAVVDIAAPVNPAIPWPNPEFTEGDITVLGGTPDEVPEAYQDFNVLSHVSVEAAPTLILHSGDDTWVPFENSRQLAAALDEAGVEMVLCKFAHIDHLDWTWANAGPWALAFLNRQFGATP